MRLAFGKEDGEYGDSVMGLTTGLLGAKSGSGRIRAPRKKKEKRQGGLRAGAGGNSVVSRPHRTRSTPCLPPVCVCAHAAMKRQKRTGASGLASSLSFTPVQGLELPAVDVRAARVKAANDKYFSSNASFVKK